MDPDQAEADALPPIIRPRRKRPYSHDPTYNPDEGMCGIEYYIANIALLIFLSNLILSCLKKRGMVSNWNAI